MDTKGAVGRRRHFGSKNLAHGSELSPARSGTVGILHTVAARPRAARIHKFTQDAVQFVTTTPTAATAPAWVLLVPLAGWFPPSQYNDFINPSLPFMRKYSC